MFISSPSPSHGFAHGGFIHFLFVRPSVFVSRDISGSVNYVFSSRLTLPAACGVKPLLVWPCKLAGVCEAAHCRGGHGSLWGSVKKKHLSLMFDRSNDVSNIHAFILTVTPAMTGAFPSISLKTSASASSPVLSLYFFLASSASAVLNSSYVMLRADFFL